MGSGKSCIGREVSSLLSCRFADLDDAVEKENGSAIPEIFSKYGESGFRRMEEKALEDIVSNTADKDMLVLSLGGGTVTTPRCAEIVKEKTVCFYLRAALASLVKNLENEAEKRPMLASWKSLESRISELMNVRSAIYEDTAAYIVDTDGKTCREAAEEIAEKIRSLR